MQCLSSEYPLQGLPPMRRSPVITPQPLPTPLQLSDPFASKVAYVTLHHILPAIPNPVFVMNRPSGLLY
jgi:hypothetical protein